MQGSGGNTSVKTADRSSMYIKASGYTLKDLSVDRGWRKLDVASVNSILDNLHLKGLTESHQEEIVKKLLRLSCDDPVEDRVRMANGAV